MITKSTASLVEATNETIPCEKADSAAEPPSRETPLEIRPTRFGKGVFAKKTFKAGVRILQFHGRLYSRQEYLSKLDPVKCHFMQIGEDTFLGPTTSADNFVNHCCEPNAGLVIEKGKAHLIAVRDIYPEEELTFDYSTSMAEDHWEMDCACGASSCRGHIRDFKYLEPTLQGKYIEMGIAPDFVIRSAGLKNPRDLFYTATATQSLPQKRKRRAKTVVPLIHVAPAY